VRRAAVAAAVGLLLQPAAGAEFVGYADQALGVSFEAPAGGEAEALDPLPGSTTRVWRVYWEEGAAEGLEVLVVGRLTAYANVVTWAGADQRRRGVTASFEPEGELLPAAELAARGVETALRTTYREGEGNERITVEVVYASAGEWLYRWEVRYPETRAAALGPVAERIIKTFKVEPAAEAEERAAAEESGPGVPAP